VDPAAGVMPLHMRIAWGTDCQAFVFATSPAFFSFNSIIFRRLLTRLFFQWCDESIDFRFPFIPSFFFPRILIFYFVLGKKVM